MDYEINPDDFNPKLEVSACIVEYGERVLFLLRQDSKPQGNTWCLPGGKVRLSEHPMEAAKRELREETGIENCGLEYVDSFNVRYPDFDFVYHVFRTFSTQKPIVVIDNKDNKGYDFLSPLDALDVILTSPLDDVIRKIYFHNR